MRYRLEYRESVRDYLRSLSLTRAGRLKLNVALIEMVAEVPNRPGSQTMPRLPTNMKPFPWKCGHCRKQAVQPAVVPYTTEAEYDGRTYTVTVPELSVPRCQSCGELVLDSAANRQITDSLRQQLGLLTPEVVKKVSGTF